MKILVVGSGGREHALAWKIAQSKMVKKIYCAPGNAGISELAECVPVNAENIPALLDFAIKNRIDLTVVGPESSLSAGIADAFCKEGLKIFGPSKAASLLESSKIFSKNIMKKYGVPTADFEVFSRVQDALKFVRTVNKPLVIKADGLCAGKGVFVCSDLPQEEEAIRKIMQEKVFGEAGSRILIEERLEGEEASILVISDGKNFIPLASSQDHKRIFDSDKGPNTGGMGAYSPAPVVTGKLLNKIQDEIIKPVIDGMVKEGIPYKGILYAGIMITGSGPKVLEFNVRFGDPETQAILPRLKSDLVEVLLKAEEEKLKEVKLGWDKRACVCVILASGGYPDNYEKGKQISGLEKAMRDKEIIVFHAGTKKENGKIFTSGGRVMAVTGLGQGMARAIEKTYAAVKKIKFDKMHYRKDIGKRALMKGKAL